MSFVKNSFEITPDVKRFIAKYKSEYDSVATVKILMDGKTGDEHGLISDDTVNSLNRSYEIFTGNKVTDDYINDIKMSVRNEIDSLISSLAEKDYYKKRKKEFNILKRVTHYSVGIFEANFINGFVPLG